MKKEPFFYLLVLVLTFNQFHHHYFRLTSPEPEHLPDNLKKLSYRELNQFSLGKGLPPDIGMYQMVIQNKVWPPKNDKHEIRLLSYIYIEFLFQNISDRLSPLPKRTSIDSYRSVSPIALANLKFKREEPSIKKQRPVRATKKRFARLQRPSEGYMPCVHESLFQ